MRALLVALRRCRTALLVVPALSAPLLVLATETSLSLGLATSEQASEIPQQGAFNGWSAIAQGRHVSPATPGAADLTSEWVGSSGTPIRVVVKQPRRTGVGTVVRMDAISSEADARPHFEAALARARREGASELVVAPGTYNFRSVDARRGAHVVVEGVRDLTIRAAGARWIFFADATGVLIQQAQRTRLEGVTLDYALRLSSIGKIERRGSDKVLAISGDYPVSENDRIHQLVEVTAEPLRFVSGGGRLIFPPGAKNAPVYGGAQRYASKAFDVLKEGATYFVLHHYYGGVAIKVDGQRGDAQTEDITLSRLSIQGAPGMGIAVTGLKRGIAVVDSTIAAVKGGMNPGSVEWDGIHVHLGGGDVLIARNHISGQGDDAINLSNPVHTIEAIDRMGGAIDLKGSARFTLAGDDLTFFDELGQYLGGGRVVNVAGGYPGQIFRAFVDHIPPGVTTKSLARNVALISSRFDISENTIEDCNCHGLLAQVPNGRIQNNVFARLNRNAIRLLANVGTWKEGVGAFNVVVRSNEIRDTGIDTAMDVPWAAVTVYSGAAGGVMSRHLFNEDIEISDNKMFGIRQHCVTVANTRRARLRGNRCEFAAEATAAKPLVVVRSLGVTSD